MSTETKDRDYKPTQKVSQRQRQTTPKRSRQVESVNYSECEIGSEMEGESVGSEGNTILLEWEIKKENSERAWTPITFSRK